MGPGFSILQIDFQNIFAWNVIFIGHNKIIKINEQKISTWVSLWEKKMKTKQNKKQNKQISKTNKKKAKYTKDIGVYVVR